MSKFISRRFSALKAYVPGEQPKDRKYMKLNTNESPYPPSAGVRRALSDEAVADLRLYSDPTLSDLKQAFADYLNVDYDCVFVGNGSDEILNFVFMTFCDSEVGVSYPDISYGFYQVYANLNQLQRNEIPLREDFTIAPEDYYNRDTTIVIANPNAPTGICLSVVDIEKILKANSQRVIVVDEAYIDFGGESCVPLTKLYDNILVVQTFSKSRSLAGARIGFAIGNAALIADLEKIRYSTNPFNVSRMSLLAGVAALKEQSYYDSNCEKTIQIRDATVIEMKSLGFEVLESCTNFIMTKHNKITGFELYKGLRERGILVRHFAKPRIDDYIRITIGTAEDMKILCDKLKEMLENA